MVTSNVVVCFGDRVDFQVEVTELEELDDQEGNEGDEEVMKGVKEIVVYTGDGRESLVHLEGHVLLQSRSAFAAIEHLSSRICACENEEILISPPLCSLGFNRPNQNRRNHRSHPPRLRVRGDDLFGGLEQCVGGVWRCVRQLGWTVEYDSSAMRCFYGRAERVAFAHARTHLAHALLAPAGAAPPLLR